MLVHIHGCSRCLRNWSTQKCWRDQGAVNGHPQYLSDSPRYFILSCLLLTPLPRHSSYLCSAWDDSYYSSRSKSESLPWALPFLMEPFLWVLLSSVHLHCSINHTQLENVYVFSLRIIISQGQPGSQLCSYNCVSLEPGVVHSIPPAAS